MGSRRRLFCAVHALQFLVRLVFPSVRRSRRVASWLFVFVPALSTWVSAQPSVGMAAKPHTDKKSSSAQEIFVEVFRLSSNPGEITIAGRAIKRLSVEMLRVQLAFQREGGAVAIPLPLKQISPDSAKHTRFEFETAICGLPEISPDDPRHTKPFFAIMVADRNGNRYYQEESYEQFTRSGEQTVPLKPVPALPPQSLFATVLSPIAKASQEQAFELRAVHQKGRACRLEWTALPGTLAAANTPSIVLRDEQHLAITFANHYVDPQLTSNPGVQYRVEQFGMDGNTYTSNTVEISQDHAIAKSKRSTMDSGVLYAANAKIERTPEALAAVVSKHNAAIQHCYQRELKRNSVLRGEMRVRIVVNPHGSVDTVSVISSTLKNPEVEDCVVGRIKRWNDFGPSDPSKGDVAIKQTYVFGY